jgi:hypothetical protein
MGYDDDLGEYEVTAPDYCAGCGRLTGDGIYSELDDSFTCDECVIEAASGYNCE